MKRGVALPAVALLVAVSVCAGVQVSCDDVIRVENAGSGGAGTAGGSTGAAPQACNAVFADCNGDAGDGCETNLGDDGAHCGSCAHDCLGATCAGGLCEPEVLASNLYFANRLTLDGTRVYWTSSGGTISALPLAGGAIDTLVAGQGEPWDLAVDAAGMYWANGGTDTVHSLPWGAALPVLLAEAGNPMGVAVHQGVLHYTDTYDKLSNDEHVVRVPLPGGPPEIVASTAGAWLVAVDDQHIYWTDPASAAVWSGPASGGAATQIASILEPRDIEVDGEAVYVTGLEGTYRIPLAGGAPETLVAGAGRGLALDATHVFVGAADGRLLKVSKTGGAAMALSQTKLYPADIAVSDPYVYWITRSIDGALVRTPR